MIVNDLYCRLLDIVIGMLTVCYMNIHNSYDWRTYTQPTVPQFLELLQTLRLIDLEADGGFGGFQWIRKEKGGVG